MLGMEAPQYGLLHDFCNLQGQKLLDHTSILQIDEFWGIEGTHQRRSSRTLDTSCLASTSPLRNEHDYLSGRSEGMRDLFAAKDPRKGRTAEILEAKNKDSSSGSHRAGSFLVPACPLTLEGRVYPDIERIPFMWEFGFLLCRKKPWDEASDLSVKIGFREGRSLTVREILDGLPQARGQVEKETQGEDRRAIKKRTGWREFLGACKAVSERFSGGKDKPTAFDLTVMSGESFFCFLLEILASEIRKRLARRSQSYDKLSREFLSSIGQSYLVHNANDRRLYGLRGWLAHPP